MSQPEITALRNGHSYRFKEEKATIIITNPRTSRGYIQANLSISVEHLEHSGEILNDSYSLSASGKDNLLKHLRQRCPELGWLPLIEWACSHFKQAFEEGEPAQEIYSEEEIRPIEWLAHPILQRNKPTILFGEPGTVKSLLSLVLGVACRLPWHDNKLGIGWPTFDCPVLYLDWEDDEETFKKRLTMLAMGMEIGPLGIHYRRCFQPIADDVEQFLRLTDTVHPGLVIIDSLGLAAGDDLVGTKAPLGVYSTIRRYQATYLIVAHTAKNPADRNNRTVYGNLYFGALARATWEVRAHSEPHSPIQRVALYQRKHNNTPNMGSLGLEFNFAPKGLMLSRYDVGQDETLAMGLRPSEQVLESLRDGPKTAQELAYALEFKPQNVSRLLTSLKEKGLVVPLASNSWGLADQVHTPEAFR